MRHARAELFAGALPLQDVLNGYAAADPLDEPDWQNDLLPALIDWMLDYDGKGKAWVRFDGRDAIVGGSRVER